MFKALIALGVIGALGYLAYQEIEVNDPPPAPSVGYPTVDAGGAGDVGDGVGGLLGE